MAHLFKHSFTGLLCFILFERRRRSSRLLQKGLNIGGLWRSFWTELTGLLCFNLFERRYGQVGFTKRLKHRRPVAFLLNTASLASFVLTFLKEGDGQVGHYKKVKT